MLGLLLLGGGTAGWLWLTGYWTDPDDVQTRDEIPYLSIDVDVRKAAALGLKPREVILQVVAASFYSSSGVGFDWEFRVDGFWAGNRFYMRCPYAWPTTGIKFEDVVNIEATGTNVSYPVKLSSLATVRRVDGTVESYLAKLLQVWRR